MSNQQEQLGNQVAVDFGDEVPYAFECLPKNRQLNAEMFSRAVERAKAPTRPLPADPLNSRDAKP